MFLCMQHIIVNICFLQNMKLLVKVNQFNIKVEQLYRYTIDVECKL